MSHPTSGLKERSLMEAFAAHSDARRTEQAQIMLVLMRNMAVDEEDARGGPRLYGRMEGEGGGRKSAGCLCRERELIAYLPHRFQF